MKMRLILGGAVCLLASNAFAVNPTIVVGNHLLLPNRAGQTFQISVSGGTQVSGLDFNAEVANGGTANGGTPGPAISSANLLSGTIFASNNSGQQVPSNLPPQVYSSFVITNGATTVSASGLLATVTIDTTGFNGGIYSFKLAGFSNGTVSGDSDFTVGPDNMTLVPVNITNGNLIVDLPGDANQDGVVNGADALTLGRNWNLQAGATWATGDFNGDGKVNSADALLLRQYWNQSININPGVPSFAAAAVDVPEPAGLAVLAAAIPLIIRRRH